MYCHAFCEDSTSFPRMSDLIDFAACTEFSKEDKSNFFVFQKKRHIQNLFCYFYLDKLMYFLYNKIYLLLILNYSPCIKQSRISYFQALNALRQLELLGLESWPTPRGPHHQAPHSSSCTPIITPVDCSGPQWAKMHCSGLQWTKMHPTGPQLGATWIPA